MTGLGSPRGALGWAALALALSRALLSAPGCVSFPPSPVLPPGLGGSLASHSEDAPPWSPPSSSSLESECFPSTGIDLVGN